MTRYFAFFGSHNQPKNALQSAAVEVLKGYSGRIISGGPTRFLNTLRVQISQLNRDHPRCSPLRVRDWIIGCGWGISLGDQFTVGFYLYEIKEDETDA